MRRRIVLCGLGLGVVAVSACGLDAIGGATVPDVVDATDSGSSGEPDGTIVPPDDHDDDAGTDADATSPPVDTSCTTSDPPCTPPDGWQPVAMRLDVDDDCPEGYTPLDVGEATLGSPQTACTCTPAKSGDVRCDKQDNYEIIGGQSDLALCLGGLKAKVNVDGDGCTPFPNGSNAANWDALKASAIAPQAGTCTPTCSAAPNAITTKSAGLCAPTPACLDGACRGSTAGTRTSGVAYCLMKNGDVPECPENRGRRLVGRTPHVECTGATCKNNDTCSSASLWLYKSTDCSDAAFASGVDGLCNKFPSKGVAAFKYSATVVNKAPSMETPATASVTYDEPMTLCCPQED